MGENIFFCSNVEICGNISTQENNLTQVVVRGVKQGMPRASGQTLYKLAPVKSLFLARFIRGIIFCFITSSTKLR